MSDQYDGAGHGQCLALKASNGERCTNGVYQSADCCGTHKRASDVTLAPEEDDRDWYRCPECGWQPADYENGCGPPFCSRCGVELPTDADSYEDTRSEAEGDTDE